MIFPLLERLSINLPLFCITMVSVAVLHTANRELHRGWVGGRWTCLGASRLLHAKVVKRFIEQFGLETNSAQSLLSYVWVHFQNDPQARPFQKSHHCLRCPSAGWKRQLYWGTGRKPRKAPIVSWCPVGVTLIFIAILEMTLR